MKINLTKGQKVIITTKDGKKNFSIKAKWDVSFTGDTDIDIQAIQLNNDKAFDICFFNQLATGDKSLVLDGDNRTGEGEGWDETISLNAELVDSKTQKIPVFVNIYDAINRGQDFAIVRNLEIGIFEEGKETPLASFIPELDNSEATAIIMGEFIIDSNKQFEFRAMGTGFKTVNDIYKKYCVNF